MTKTTYLQRIDLAQIKVPTNLRIKKNSVFAHIRRNLSTAAKLVDQQEEKGRRVPPEFRTQVEREVQAFERYCDLIKNNTTLQDSEFKQFEEVIKDSIRTLPSVDYIEKLLLKYL